MSGRFTYQSSFDTVGESRDPDIVYYNASIVNNNTDDFFQYTGASDPQIRFNETRDTSIVRDASKYQFSIIRFVVNGANLDLPLFIPAIQSFTGQTNVNLTEYGVGISWSGTITPTSGGGAQTFNFAPPLTYIEFVPEYQNPTLAPVPRTTANQSYVGIWNGVSTYKVGDIVAITDPAIDPLAVYYRANLNNTNEDPTSPTTNLAFWSLSSPELGQPQDITTRYYWLQTYSWWVQMVNTALNNANIACYNAYVAQNATDFTSYDGTTGTPWTEYYPAPFMKYSETTGLFSVYYPQQYRAPSSAPSGGFQQLYLNVNLSGLFANFPSIYLNTPVHTGLGGWLNPSPPTLFPDGYAVLLLPFVIGLDENVLPTPGSPSPPTYAGTWLIMTQNYASTSSLWSPCDSIVFTSTLLPIKNEQTAPPNALGSRNTGNSTATSLSAFTPIITDIALDLSTDPNSYRKMIYYAPSAQYRMSDFQNSRTDIRNIDIQVWWKNRLDNQLYPLNMFNLTSVSFKLMFRKKHLPAKDQE